ncbi:ABC transporter ATP-binding protein [Pseudonocardia sp. KRD-184]|uniref:ABC transporter ATP-binding protein n=2 Tax=Pseudonocardia oceani TaxID=2792013 RepID=A0ABS6U1E0_9PSEU|nr:ABC transporter ATP-binding protein [Pseudonocardia oceani]MBW0093619.1 ABC transporter ATP-binding protein [Pseudonocardia oceani]MBW0100292.1 ABC transporter ATP-binding protein [Pseudonocardia oceani]MBW0111432.1 ABC transporter ATP-binding protein [Pseudonocardia oceani]MBW0120807.1 ABC transporter ATP-binding protein [Pseudonocardia oceani]MBW0126078.1 ABC transporter ATP-binding protein [Pseudonocardia oceani]
MAAQRRGGGPPWGAVGQPGEKASDFLPSVKRLARRLSPERTGVVAVLVLCVVSVALNVIGPLLLGRATDVIFAGVIGRSLPAGVTAEQAAESARAAGDTTTANLIAVQDIVPGSGIDFTALSMVLLAVIALYLAASVFGYAQGYLLNGIVQRTIYQLRREVEDKIHRLPLRYVDSQQRGEVLSRATNDIDNVSTSLQQTLSQLLTSLLTVIGVVVMMFVVSPLLTLVALVTIPVSLWLTKAITQRSQPQFVAQWRHTGRLNGLIEEAFTGHELVRVFGRTAEVERQFAERNDDLFGASFRAQFISGIIMPAMMFVGNLNYVVVAVIGGLRVASGTMSLGDVQAFIQYSRQFTQPLTQAASMANVLQSGVASAERVFELLDAPEQSPDPAVPATRTERRGRVAFEHVGFRYLPDSPLIEDLSLVAEPGQTVAIVGPTGAGKTTLVNLVLRFYELDAGRITLDGVDIATMARADLRSGIGMVLQDTWLFGGTIRDNIAYGNPSATPEQVLDAARATYVDRFVRSLPDGYDTVIDEEGSNVSAGEKQLITIARAFLADPSLLILDEATSSVDTRTEVLVQRAMAALRGSGSGSARTSFVIAHRLSTIRDADLILVMEAGRIVEQGTHEQLLAARGAYCALYNAQFAAAAADL